MLHLVNCKCSEKDETDNWISKPCCNYSGLYESDPSDIDEERVQFEIPVNDMGDADFLPTMDVKLLARWIMTKENEKE